MNRYKHRDIIGKILHFLVQFTFILMLFGNKAENILIYGQNRFIKKHLSSIINNIYRNLQKIKDQF